MGCLLGLLCLVSLLCLGNRLLTEKTIELKHRNNEPTFKTIELLEQEVNEITGSKKERSLSRHGLNKPPSSPREWRDAERRERMPGKMELEDV